MSGVLQPDGRYVYSIFQSGFRPSTWSCNNQIHSNFDITNKSIRPFLFTILNISLYQIICNMLSKSSKWELGFVHYITKFTILRFVISRFECIFYIYFFRVLTLKTTQQQKWLAAWSKLVLSVNCTCAISTFCMLSYYLCINKMKSLFSSNF